jgi:hypothetical protein
MGENKRISDRTQDLIKPETIEPNGGGYAMTVTTSEFKENKSIVCDDEDGAKKWNTLLPAFFRYN